MSSKHTIAIIAGQLVVGGAERQLYLWLAHLDRQRFQPVVLTLHPDYGDYWEPRIRQLGIPLLPIPRRSNRFLRLLDIIRTLHPYQPALIHGWHLFSSPYAGAAAKWFGARSLGGVRGSFRTFRSAALESNLTLTLADDILANSKSTAQEIRKMRRPMKQRIYAVQNAVEMQSADRDSLRQELSQRFNIPSSGVWIGSVGRLDREKHFDVLLQVMARLRGEIKGFHFILIGDGLEKRRLEQMSESLGIEDSVIFAGERPCAREWLCALDIFCYASTDEGLPNVIMEAAAAGLPVLAWKLPFIEELMQTDKTALLIEAGDLQGFEDALLRLAQSPQLRAEIGKAGQNYMLERFSLPAFVQRMTSVYQELLGIQPVSVSVDL